MDIRNKEEELMNCISQIKALQEALIIFNEEMASEKLVMEGIECRESLKIQGKNKEQREAMLNDALSSNEDYLHHRKCVSSLSKEIEKKKIDLEYLRNLLSVHKTLSRYFLANAVLPE